jgi:hypothetical protein
MSQIAKNKRKTKKKTITRAPKMWKKTLRMKKRTNPRKAANVSDIRIKDPVKKSFIMCAMTYLFQTPQLSSSFLYRFSSPSRFSRLYRFSRI